MLVSALLLVLFIGLTVLFASLSDHYKVREIHIPIAGEEIPAWSPDLPVGSPARITVSEILESFSGSYTNRYGGARPDEIVRRDVILLVRDAEGNPFFLVLARISAPTYEDAIRERFPSLVPNGDEPAVPAEGLVVTGLTALLSDTLRVYDDPSIGYAEWQKIRAMREAGYPCLDVSEPPYRTAEEGSAAAYDLFTALKVITLWLSLLSGICALVGLARVDGTRKALKLLRAKLADAGDAQGDAQAAAPTPDP